MLDTTTRDQIEIWTGNQAVAEAAILAKPDVIAAYPITPSTPIIQRISDAVYNNEINAEFIAVESEHAAMSGSIGASVAGARAFTATSAQGLLYMMEMIYWAGYGRLPITMALVNRALAPGWSIWVDHQDMYSMSNAGWIQMVAKNNQEAHDMIFQSFKLSEDHDVYMPSAVNLDGFVLSHVAGQVNPLTQKQADDYLPEFDPLVKMTPEDPFSFGSLTLPDDYKLLRQDLINSMDSARDIFKENAQEFTDLTGRDWGGLVEYYGPDHADTVIIAMGTMAEEIEETVDILNREQEGKIYASLRIRMFRPFPIEEVMNAAKNCDTLIVLERGFSFGSDAPLLKEVKNAIFEFNNGPEVKGKVVGYGGADISFKELKQIIKNLEEMN